eukprot:3949775-Prymnesium_polylepis.1
MPCARAVPHPPQAPTWAAPAPLCAGVQLAPCAAPTATSAVASPPPPSPRSPTPGAASQPSPPSFRHSASSPSVSHTAWLLPHPPPAHQPRSARPTCASLPPPPSRVPPTHPAWAGQRRATSPPTCPPPSG